MDDDDHQEEAPEQVKLFGMWASPYVLKVRWALSIKGVEYEYVEEDLRNKSHDLLEHNHVHKKVPVLLYRGIPVAESDVIVEFVDEAWSHRGGRILPDDPHERAMARLWVRFVHDKELIAVGGKDFFAGESVELVDLSLGALAYVVPMYEEIIGVRLVTEERFPSLSAWMGRFLDSPPVKDHPPLVERLKPRYRAMREAFLNMG
uniref:GST N-terminal domain-containing protein n=1 Tax=Aegilops tauschii TaxID=37682 RepID=M8AZM0_AEGTA